MHRIVISLERPDQVLLDALDDSPALRAGQVSLPVLGALPDRDGDQIPRRFGRFNQVQAAEPARSEDGRQAGLARQDFHHLAHVSRVHFGP